MASRRPFAQWSIAVAAHTPSIWGRNPYEAKNKMAIISLYVEPLHFEIRPATVYRITTTLTPFFLLSYAQFVLCVASTLLGLCWQFPPSTTVTVSVHTYKHTQDRVYTQLE